MSLIEGLRRAVGGLRKGAAEKPTMSHIIPSEAVLIAPLDDLALVILGSLASITRSSVISTDVTTASWSASYPSKIRTRVKRRLIEAWFLLQQRGYIAPDKILGTYETWFVTERGREALQAGRVSFGPADLLPSGLLVAPIRDAALPLYISGRYEDACVAAFKQLEIVVRRLSALPESLVGIDLMNEAFKVNVGPLSISSDLEAEQLAARSLFVGAIGYYRNPLMHREVGITLADQAASVILLANELVATALHHRAVKDREQST